MLGCTLEGNQLRHCAAKPIVQLAIIANTNGFFTPGVLGSRDQPSMSRTHYPQSNCGSEQKRATYMYIIVKRHILKPHRSLRPRFDFLLNLLRILCRVLVELPMCWRPHGRHSLWRTIKRKKTLKIRAWKLSKLQCVTMNLYF